MAADKARRAEILIDAGLEAREPGGVAEPIWSWVLVAENGAAVARSVTDYRQRSNAVRAARGFAERLRGRVAVRVEP